jgi:hypothetical protein
MTMEENSANLQNVEVDQESSELLAHSRVDAITVFFLHTGPFPG